MTCCLRGKTVIMTKQYKNNYYYYYLENPHSNIDLDSCCEKSKCLCVFYCKIYITPTTPTWDTAALVYMSSTLLFLF